MAAWVRVTWRDACRAGGIFTERDFAQMSLATVTQAGMLVKEDDEKIYLANEHHTFADGTEHWRDTQLIPKVNIVRIEPWESAKA